MLTGSPKRSMRLEARRLVEAQHGRGLIVADPAVAADLGFLADWLDALADDPVAAVRLLGELLELRRATTVRLLVRHRDGLLPLLDDFETALAHSTKQTAEDIAAADLLVARAVVERSGELLARTLLNSWERAVAEQPDLLAAAYDDPTRNARTQRAVLDAVREGGAALADRIDAAYADIDHHTLAVFGQRLRRRKGGSPCRS